QQGLHRDSPTSCARRGNSPQILSRLRNHAGEPHDVGEQSRQHDRQRDDDALVEADMATLRVQPFALQRQALGRHSLVFVQVLALYFEYLRKQLVGSIGVVHSSPPSSLKISRLSTLPSPAQRARQRRSRYGIRTPATPKVPCENVPVDHRGSEAGSPA